MAKMTILADDYGLDDISLELFALKDFRALIEKQIDSLRQSAEVVLDAAVRRERLSPDDGEWHLAQGEYYEHVEVFLPRFFRGPFLVALYAVYESAVTEIAGLIRGKQQQALSLDDIRGNFLDRANKYFKDVLHFELCSDNTAWERIKMLSELRNAIAHTNGRVELLKDTAQKAVRTLEAKDIGISTMLEGYIIVSSTFLQGTFEIVRNSLEDLVGRYKEWDSKYHTP